MALLLSTLLAASESVKHPVPASTPGVGWRGGAGAGGYLGGLSLVLHFSTSRCTHSPVVTLWLFVGVGMLALAGSVSWLIIRLGTSMERQADPELLPRVAALEVMVKGLPSLWEEERDRVERTAKRIAVSQARARERSEESDQGQEPDDVRQRDGEEQPGLHSVPQNMDRLATLRRQHVLGQIGRVD